jgi:hypothetical protein
MFESRLGQALGPWGLLAVGVVAGVMAAPPLRKGARRLAVLTTRSVLSIADEAKKVANGAKGELDKLVEEAKILSTETVATID